MATAEEPRRPWVDWLRSWDRQQEAYLPERERSFELILDVLEASVGRRFRVLDLGSGPGSLSARILRRFPAARVVAVDLDPVLLAISRHALTRYRPRIDWLETDLARAGRFRSLGRARFDAAVSSTALHWLEPAAMRGLYAELGRRLRPGGVFLNLDFIPWPVLGTDLRALSRRSRRISARRTGRPDGSRRWAAWWAGARREPAFRAALAVRATRFPKLHPDTVPLDDPGQRRALRRAGFRRVEVLHQLFELRLLYARR